MLSESNRALFRRREAAGEGSNGWECLGVRPVARRGRPLLRDRLHSDVSERGPVSFALPEVGGKSGVGCREWVVMQSASGGKPANEEQEREA